MPWPSNLLEAIRKRPGLYIGECSLSALYFTIGGYSLALGQHKITKDDNFSTLDRGFHDWVAYRLHFYESTSGWRNMILSATPNEKDAFNRFFELFDQYMARKAVTFATLSQPEWDESDYIGFKRLFGDDLQTWVKVKNPQKLSLITYTNDPGFFALYEESPGDHPFGEFHPSIDSCELRTRTNRSQWKIINQDIFERVKSQNPEL